MVHTKASPARIARVVRLQAREDRIIEAATGVVAEHGWQGAQMALIANRAGVATGSVYRHFTSKADLYARVLATVSEREIAAVDVIARADRPATDRLRDGIRAFMQRALHRRQLAYALIAEPCEPEIDRARIEYRVALARVCERLIADGVMRGEFRVASPAVAASCVTGAMMEALVGPLAPQAQPQSAQAEALVTETARLCVAMVTT
ncbi:MAG: TetR/AcrR family transcriptional regulator [Acidobacteria bacterium]|nr:TetR/AcrR family transcriptional regulator [Acidobacteriota bacterium]